MKTSSQPIRLKVAGHLDELLSKCNSNLCKTATMQSQLFRTAAALLEDGSIETRTHAKRLIFALKRFLPPATMASLQQQRISAIQAARVVATLELLGPPEPPQRLIQSFAVVLGWNAATAYAQQVRAKLPPQDGIMPSTGHPPSAGTLTSRDSNTLTSGGSSSFTSKSTYKGRMPPRSTAQINSRWDLGEGSLRKQTELGEQKRSTRGHQAGDRCRKIGTKASGSRISRSVGPVYARGRADLLATRRGCDVGGYIAC
jgi:hypothetical protein